MIKYIKIKKTIACFFLSLLTIEMLMPAFAWALTSGPAQPESQQFVTAGTNDMVDPFTGAFKYDVPIMDIDGYPINLNYQSGIGMDDEASWVGLGWNLNAGAINRQLRGIPDDFKGDIVVTEHKMKPKTTVGGRGTLKTEITGINIAKLSGSLSVGVFNDSYTGIGAEVGSNAGLSFSIANSGMLTAGMGIGVNSNTSDGVTVKPHVSLSLAAKVGEQSSTNMSLSAVLGYNTRQGLKDLSLSQSFGISGTKTFEDRSSKSGSTGWEVNGSSYSYNTPAFYPQAGIGYKSTNKNYSIDLGVTYTAVFVGGGLTGYYSKREVAKERITNQAYGFLYAEKGTVRDSALMDFMREKDAPVVRDLPNLAVPIATPDVFSFSSQAESGQFRLYRGGSGVLFDAESNDVNDNETAGLDLGFGGYFHGGVNFYDQYVLSKTGKWKEDNPFLPIADYPVDSTRKTEEQVYFKRVGEKNLSDNNFINRIHGESVVSVPLLGKSTRAGLQQRDNFNMAGAPYKKDGRQIKRSNISWLTADEAAQGALDKQIMNAPFQDSATFSPASCRVTSTNNLPRNGGIRKGHHLSEITVQGDDGKRMVYGLPTYNTTQEEYSVAVDPAKVDSAKNLVTTDIVNGLVVPYDSSRDKYFHHEIQPAYASAYLLTAILSPDYVDVTGDGITDDDLGTAIRFNYSKVSGVYKWRSPYEFAQAIYNKGLSADGKDDKGSFVYGEKELWYLQSIETKTKIIYFITKDRDDALGVTGVNGGRFIGTRQKYLKEVRLYSKSDLQQPIKTAYFEYDYSLCPSVPNHITVGGGKLTLKKVYFKYGSSGKGKSHPYSFTYGNNQAYAYLSADRWGAYKPKYNNTVPALRNDEFPYSLQDKSLMDNSAGKWHLTKIELPTGGAINVDYESGDYAYVQDKKAMEMVKVEALIKADGVVTTNLNEAAGFRVKTPVMSTGSVEEQTKFFKEHYLNGSDMFYGKLFTNVSDDPNNTDDKRFEFIPCYAKVIKAQFANDYANVIFEDMTSGKVTNNPFLFAAWQKMRMEYPQYAYPGYQNSIPDDRALEAALGALVNAIGNLAELRENFYQRALRKKFANRVKLEKSFCRLVKTNGHKLGGGARVKRVRISDNWQTMSKSTAPGASYGQEYAYVKTENRNGKTDEIISSGVASYEPGIGSDENPLRMPVPYTEQMKGTMNNYFYLEEPFGESLYPAAQVGYSRVTVRELNAAGIVDPDAKTGWTAQEFYTAKEFPVLVDYEKKPAVQNYQPPGWQSFVGGHIVHELTMSQGYVVILNDMHGKIKSERIYNQSGSEISSTVYHYNASQIDAGKYRLRNSVTVTDEKGTLTPNQVIGREIEMFVDLRQQEIDNKGTAIQIGVDVVPFFWGIPLPIPHWPRKENDEYRLFRSACVLKTVQYSGILDKVVKTVNGASVTSANLVYDKYTGDAVVVQTNNEFDDPVYSINMPAYWVYEKMGGAYKNQNTILEGFNTDAAGVINNSYGNFLSAGDELLNLTSGNGERLWVVFSATNEDATQKLRVIGSGGEIKHCNGIKVKVLRSGFRNQLTSAAASITCLNDPIAGNRLAIFNTSQDTTYRVLDAKATLYDEKWGMPTTCITCPSGYVLSTDGINCIVPPVENTDTSFQVVAGDIAADTSYGMNGAFFYERNLTDVLVGEKVSDFWGGDCGGYVSFFKTAIADNSLAQRVVAGDSGSMIMKKKPENTQGINKTAPGYVGKSAPQGVQALLSKPRGFCGRLINAGIWLKGANGPSYYNKWLGVESCFDVPGWDTYSVGFAADNQVKIYIDDVLFKSITTTNSDAFTKWMVYPVVLFGGRHKIRIEAMNDGLTAAVAVEVYNGTPSFIMNQTGAYVAEHTLFSTFNLRNKPVSTFINDNGNIITRYTCPAGTSLDICAMPCNCGSVPAGVLVNPYLTGFLGNWRVSEEQVFQVARNDDHFHNNGGVDVRNTGNYKAFTPFWTNNNGADWVSGNSNKWTSVRYITLYDKYGQELENRNVINVYSSALYGYKGALPTAVASNAMQRQLFYDGFDDYDFQNLCNTGSACVQDSFNIFSSLGSNYAQRLNRTDAHTGNNSLKLSNQDAIRLYTRAHDKVHKSVDYLGRGPAGEYIKKPLPDLYPRGFSPNSTGKYVFSVWVKDGQPPSTGTGINLKVNNTNITLTRKATVEGWALVEGLIDLTAILGSNKVIEMTLLATASNTLIDDLRIFPFDALVKSYAYDDKKLKVMAVLDENNFATFYEYDEEGSMTRVKKETDRGIMTIQESRSSYIKK